MKFKKIIITLLITSMVATAVGCGSKTNMSKEEKPQTESQKAEQGNGSAGSIDALLARENEIFDTHIDSWNKVFGAISKEDAMANQSMNYADFLAKTIEENSSLFTDEERTQFKKDLKEIFEIEEEIKKLDEVQSQEGDAKSESVPAENVAESAETFPKFTGKDFDGNVVDHEVFSKNKVTVVNLWFNGCKPCVMELPKLEELHQELKSKGCEVIGINSEALSENKPIIDEAKKILKEQGATYRNIYFEANSEAGKFVRNILTFPTTFVVDQNGNIVGDPILGGIDEEKNYSELLKRIEAILNE